MPPTYVRAAAGVVDEMASTVTTARAAYSRPVAGSVAVPKTKTWPGRAHRAAGTGRHVTGRAAVAAPTRWARRRGKGRSRSGHREDRDVGDAAHGLVDESPPLVRGGVRLPDPTDEPSAVACSATSTLPGPVALEIVHVPSPVVESTTVPVVRRRPAPPRGPARRIAGPAAAVGAAAGSARGWCRRRSPASRSRAGRRRGVGRRGSHRSPASRASDAVWTPTNRYAWPAWRSAASVGDAPRRRSTTSVVTDSAGTGTVAECRRPAPGPAPAARRRRR